MTIQSFLEMVSSDPHLSKTRCVEIGSEGHLYSEMAEIYTVNAGEEKYTGANTQTDIDNLKEKVDSYLSKSGSFIVIDYANIGEQGKIYSNIKNNLAFLEQATNVRGFDFEQIEKKEVVEKLFTQSRASDEPKRLKRSCGCILY